ncbi:cell division cycle-related protein [Paramarasmius palmivorus]|uniref:Cell division cycle-related protein n=1 Tax=Paramarasmius palmivorus TaxID=297713 RepID=A0AAW0AM93_9AGAR
MLAARKRLILKFLLPVVGGICTFASAFAAINSENPTTTALTVVSGFISIVVSIAPFFMRHPKNSSPGDIEGAIDAEKKDELPSSPPSPSPTLVEQPTETSPLFCRALYDYQSVNKNELKLRKGDVIEVLSQQPSGWWDGLLGDERAWFPSNYVTVIDEEEAEGELSSSSASKE